MRYVALDFETANSDRSSVCAMGIAVIEGQEITRRTSWLIRPPELYFDSYNISIHGITEEDVADKPEFHEYWDEFKQYFEERNLVAHSASFDMSVLRKVLDRYEIPYPQLNYFCTRVIAKRIWPNLINYGLATLSEFLEIKFQHHDAEEDAVACAKVALHALRKVGVRSLEELTHEIDISKGRLYPGGYKHCGVKLKYMRPSEILPATDKFDLSHPFFGKSVVFTGTLRSIVRREAMQKVVDCGGRCANSMSKNVNYLVMGDQDFSKLKDGKQSTKHKKAKALIADGADLELVPEAEFLKLLVS